MPSSARSSCPRRTATGGRRCTSGRTRCARCSGGTSGRSGSWSRAARPARRPFDTTTRRSAPCAPGDSRSSMTAHAYALLDSYVYGFALQEATLPFRPTPSRRWPRRSWRCSPLDEYPHFVELTTDVVLQPGYSLRQRVRVRAGADPRRPRRGADVSWLAALVALARRDLVRLVHGPDAPRRLGSRRGPRQHRVAAARLQPVEVADRPRGQPARAGPARHRPGARLADPGATDHHDRAVLLAGLS